MSPLALTGTPGTGKTTLARLLDRPRLELSDYYKASSDGRDDGGEWLVDLEQMATAVAHDASPEAVIIPMIPAYSGYWSSTSPTVRTAPPTSSASSAGLRPRSSAITIWLCSPMMGPAFPVTAGVADSFHGWPA